MLAWSRIGANPQVIEFIDQGIKLPIDECTPFHLTNYREINTKQTQFLREEIKRLLTLNYIKVCDKKPRFISPIGCVPKKGKNKFRLIHDLRHLNSHCEACTFKQEDIRTVEKVIQPDDYLTSVDLKDGFFHFKVREDCQEFLSFEFEGTFYSFRVLCFGFCLSPYFFYKCLRPVVAYLRSLDIRLVLYVDDFLICAERARIRDHTDLVIHTLEDLGLHVNFEKSVLTPTKDIKYLGYRVNTLGEYPVISTTKERVYTIKRLLKQLLIRKECNARLLARCAGLCVSTAWVVSPGKLFLRNIYNLLGQRKSWFDILKINESAILELTWWLEKIDVFNTKTVKPNPITISFEVDASSLGWGAVLGDKQAKGDFNHCLSKASSNYRELTAILYAILTFRIELTDQHVLIFSDNSTAIAYVKNKGGPVIELNKIAIRIWEEAERLGLSISCRHLAGLNNVTADALSRCPDRHSWMLNPNIFQVLEHKWGPHTVDRFATFQNAQTARYNSLFWDVGTEAVDAFTQDWGEENNFINPPWALLSRIVEKLIADRATATVIAPRFPAQTWFHHLRHLSVCPPIRLPQHRNTLISQGAQAEPRKNPKWRMLAWRVCGRQT